MADTTSTGGLGHEDNDIRTCAVCGGPWTVAQGHRCPGPQRPPKRRPLPDGAVCGGLEELRAAVAGHGGEGDSDAYRQGYQRGLALGALTDEQREAIDAANAGDAVKARACAVTERVLTVENMDFCGVEDMARAVVDALAAAGLIAVER